MKGLETNQVQGARKNKYELTPLARYEGFGNLQDGSVCADTLELTPLARYEGFGNLLIGVEHLHAEVR